MHTNTIKPPLKKRILVLLLYNDKHAINMIMCIARHTRIAHYM